MKNLTKKAMHSQLKNHDADLSSHAHWLAFYEIQHGCEYEEEEIPGYILEFFAEIEKKKDTRPVQAGSLDPFYSDKKQLAGKCFVFTSAQNNTRPHLPFLQAMENFCARNDAQLIIGQYVYNKNGFQNGISDSDEIHYDERLKQYLMSERAKVCDGLAWCGELNILPTAKNPLSGFEQYTGELSSIIPTSKIALESVAVSKGKPTKTLYGTGTVTLRNYIAKKAGQAAEAAHCYGALVVAIGDNGQWYARQIQTGNGGEFQDLKTIYHPDGSITDGEIVALNLGDIHAEKSDHDVLDVVFNMIEYFQPKNLLLHDLLDFTSRNHHNKSNPHFLAQTFYNDQTVESDLDTVSTLLTQFARAVDGHVYVVESNHDLALEKWLSEPKNVYDFRSDPVNALLYLKLQTYCYTRLSEGEPIRLLDYALDIEPSIAKKITFLETDESLIFMGIEFAVHGHIGANGSRGSPKQFMKLNFPMNTGHTHSPSIHGQVYTSGVTGSLEMGYNIGPSSWAHGHILTYGTGYRTIIQQKGSNWAFM